MSAPTTRLLLHIGLSKTGTTTLQKSLFPNHPEIYYLGKHLGSTHPAECRSQDIYDFLNPMLWDFSRPLEVESCETIWRDKIIPGVDPGKLIVASWEGMGGSGVEKHTERMNRVQSFFGSYKVMLVIRHPSTLIPSLYLQNIRNNFIQQNRPWMGKSPYIDIDDWFHKRTAAQRPVDFFLSYWRNIQISVDVLGKENVGVFVFERLLEDPDRYHSDICNFLGIDVATGLALTRQKHMNRRLTQNQLEFLQRMNGSTWGRSLLRVIGERSRSYILEANAGDGAPAKISLPCKWEQAISDATRAGNRWLCETYNLPLEEYNYPL